MEPKPIAVSLTNNSDRVILYYHWFFSVNERGHSSDLNDSDDGIWSDAIIERGSVVNLCVELPWSVEHLSAEKKIGGLEFSLRKFSIIDSR